MNVTLQKWGNSQGIRIPKSILDELGYEENDKMEITTEDDCIILKRVKKKHMTVKERVVEFYAKPLDEIRLPKQSEEIDTGNPVGEEIW